jgi:hypothetical protein
MAVDILLLFGAKDGSVQPDPAFLEAGKRPRNNGLGVAGEERKRPLHLSVQGPFGFGVDV